LTQDIGQISVTHYNIKVTLQDITD